MTATYTNFHYEIKVDDAQELYCMYLNGSLITLMMKPSPKNPLYKDEDHAHIAYIVFKGISLVDGSIIDYEKVEPEGLMKILEVIKKSMQTEN